MEHDWKKLHSFWKWQPKIGTRQKTCHFHRGHLLCKAVRHPSLSNLVMIFIWIDEGHIVIKSVKIIWIFIIANWGNVDLTEKQHSRHQQLCRIPLSQLDASSRQPRSRDHIFSHSISKARVPQGPDIWYVTFYKIKYPFTKPQSPTPFNSNSHTSLLYHNVELNEKLYSKTGIVSGIYEIGISW